jgi:O-6-methylguanine DNA methyltransferase
MGFSERVYSLLEKVPEGKVVTYSQLAKAAGSPGAARAVGTLMRKNRHPDKIPCYRVVRSDGDVGEYSGRGGREAKIRKLETDGIEIRKGKIADFQKARFRF